MQIVNASIELLEEINTEKIMSMIEKAGRVCYKSEDKIKEDSSEKFIAAIIRRGHESVIEHEKITLKILCDRGVSHEIVRHRIASYSQESTRYCNYASEKFGSELTFVRPCFWDESKPEDAKKIDIWSQSMQSIENSYNAMIAAGAKPDEARSLLPNSLKTEIVVTMNLRAWRHFLKLRSSKEAHPQIREVAALILKEFKEKLPIIFGDI